MITVALALAVGGCREDEDQQNLLQEDQLRDCLADAGLESGAENGGSALILLPAPDFVVNSEDGTDISVTVYGTEPKAERAAADAGSATQTLGDSVEVASERNAVLIFNPPPSEATREAAEGCLG